jgi:hypothetical protein
MAQTSPEETSPWIEGQVMIMNSRSDGNILWETYCQVMFQKMLSNPKPINYLMQARYVEAARGRYPEGPTRNCSPEELSSMSTKDISIYKLLREQYDRDWKYAEERNKKIEDDFSSALGLMLKLLDVSCKAYKMITRLLASELSNEEKYHAAWEEMAKQFKPNTVSNAVAYRRELEFLTDHGILFTDFHIKFDEIVANLERIGDPPDDNTLTHHLETNVYNHHFREMKNAMTLSHREKDSTYPWSKFLSNALTLANSRPDINEATLKKALSLQVRTAQVAMFKNKNNPVVPRSQAHCIVCFSRSHLVGSCRATKCLKCGASFAPKSANTSVPLPHDCRRCEERTPDHAPANPPPHSNAPRQPRGRPVRVQPAKAHRTVTKTSSNDSRVVPRGSAQAPIYQISSRWINSAPVDEIRALAHTLNRRLQESEDNHSVSSRRVQNAPANSTAGGPSDVYEYVDV